MKPLPALPGYIHGEREKLHADDLAFRRAIVDRLGMFDECPRARCRRAEACRSKGVVCFDEERAVLIDCMFEFIYEGYRRAPEEDDGDDYVTM